MDDRLYPAAILAGGRSTRMGGGLKFMLPLDGRPMISSVLERIAGQAAEVAIIANCDPTILADFNRPVVADGAHAARGPLSGILAAVEWAAATADASHVLTAAADTPFLPLDLATRLAHAAHPGSIAIASSSGRAHPVFGLWPLAVRDALADFLSKSERSSVMAFLSGQEYVTVDFPISPAGDPFFNVNTPADLKLASARARSPR